MIPKEIKELRKKLELSQERFAQKVGVSVGTVNRWERGEHKPYPLALEKLRKLEEDYADFCMDGDWSRKIE